MRVGSDTLEGLRGAQACYEWGAFEHYEDKGDMADHEERLRLLYLNSKYPLPEVQFVHQTACYVDQFYNLKVHGSSQRNPRVF